MAFSRNYVTASKGIVTVGTSSVPDWRKGESDLEVIGTISASHYLGLPVFDITGSWSGSYFMVSGTISASNYEGIPVGSGSNIADYNATRVIHEPCVYAGGGFIAPGQNPVPTAYGALITAVFTVDDLTERGYRVVKIPSNYVSSASFHVHWTKSGNVSEQNRNVRWRVGYVIYDGKTQVADATTNFIDFEQTYLASDTTNRVVYRTVDTYITGFQPGYYCSMYIQAISPTGSALINSPALVGLDLLYRGYINQGN